MKIKERMLMIGLVMLAGMPMCRAQIAPETIERLARTHDESILFLTGTVRYLCGRCTREHEFRVMSTVIVAATNGQMLAAVAGPLADPDTELRRVQLQVRLPGGDALPMRVAVTDEDLGLMILVPKREDESYKFKALPLDTEAEVGLLDPVVVLRRHDQATGYALSSACSRIESVQTRPQRIYFSSGFGSEQGVLPCFDAAGRLVALAMGDQRAIAAEEVGDLLSQAQPE